jgi:hypothetical protein
MVDMKILRFLRQIFKVMHDKLIILFAEAVRRNPYCQRPSQTDFVKVASEWLRLAYDRDGGRKERAFRKAASAAVALPTTVVVNTADHYLL